MTVIKQRASAKGLFCGSSLIIHLLQGGEIHGLDTEVIFANVLSVRCGLTMIIYKGSLIPVGEDIAEFKLANDVNWVLVVEKDVSSPHYLSAVYL